MTHPTPAQRMTRWAAIVMLLLIAAPASANAGTPLMWAGMLHLVAGNTLLGIGEWLLLTRLLGITRTASGCPLMIVANYASAWLGMVLLRAMAVPQPTIVTIALWLSAAVAIAFLITLAIEFPFVLVLGKGQRLPWRRVARAVLITHLISYTVLAAWYGSASRMTFMTGLTVVPAADLAPSEQIAVWYLSSDRQRVQRMDLDDTPPRVVAEIPARRLAITTDGAGALRIHASRSDRFVTDGAVLIADGLHGQAVSDGPEKWPHPFGSVPSIGDDGWRFRIGHWAADGIIAEHPSSGVRARFALETPFAAWPVRHAVHLGSGRVVFQLGSDQICLLDAASRRIALVARGAAPVAIRMEQMPDAPSAVRAQE